MKIIFLDIDGPMIPTGTYFMESNASFKQYLDPRCVAVIKALCENSGAKIVFNTTHSKSLYKNDTSEGLIAAFHANGLGDHLFHTHICTAYPSISRDKAVQQWLDMHPAVTHWVCIDDTHVNVTNFVPVNVDYGISLPEYNEAAIFLDIEPILILI